MKNDNIVILHVFQDGLIFKDVADAYDSISGVENLYYFYSPQHDFKLMNITDERVKIIQDFNEYVSYFSNPEIDVILFYSLPYPNYYLFDYIDDRKMVIWWAWGYDLYYNQRNYPPLISTGEMLKPLTKEYVEKHNNKMVCSKKGLLKAKRVIKQVIDVFNLKKQSMKPHKTQDEILSRIDYFYSPLELEYNLMKESHRCFTAKFDFKISKMAEIPFVFKKIPGNVLINHSLTHTDNHLDVFEYIYKAPISETRKYILPVSYGTGGNYNGNPQNLINEARFDNNQAMWLTKTLPLNEYKNLINTVSHAVFGMLRQQALGNIYMCLKSGVKVYLFKDSIVYKELKNMGYVVFAIEDDLTTDSLSSCLSEDDARLNFNLYIGKISKSFPINYREKFKIAVSKKQDIIKH